MKDIKCTVCGLSELVFFPLQHSLPSIDHGVIKLQGSKGWKRVPWWEMIDQFCPLKRWRETLRVLFIKPHLSPCLYLEKYSLDLAFLWDNEVVLASVRIFSFVGKLNFFPSIWLTDVRMIEGQMIIQISIFLHLTCACLEALCCHQDKQDTCTWSHRILIWFVRDGC